MKKNFIFIVALMMLLFGTNAEAQERRPIDSEHPAWLIHVDVWNKADPQKIIDLIPDDVKPYVILNLSLSCQYDTEKNVYKMPQNAVKTYKSWGTVCQQNGMWFTCQPASGGHTHIQDNDLETFEYFYKKFPNFLGWNYAEQFWGFDEANDKSSSTQSSRIALFAKLVPMAHKYGGFLTVSFCGNIWSHPLNPVGMMKRNSSLLKACQEYPEAMLWLYKYTTSSCFYNNESVTFSPFVSGLAKNYGVRYDNCGWNGALDALLGSNHGKKYPIAAGIGTVMEQTCVNGGAVWDGPELIWTEDFQNLSNSNVNGYNRRNWGTFSGFDNAWIDMFRKVIDGTMYIPTRQEVVEKTKIIVINNITSGNDEQKYAAWGDLYDGLYKQKDPFNRGNGQWMDNFCYFKKTGRYGAIPVAINTYDDLSKAIPVKVQKSSYTTRWNTQAKKVAEFNKYYPEVSTGDLYVNRYKNQLITYNPHTYLNDKKDATGYIPLEYNTCDSLYLHYSNLGSGAVREFSDHIDFYLNNYRTDETSVVLDEITIVGATAQPTYTLNKRAKAVATVISNYDAETGKYVLKVKHMGPVDITISCLGAATDRKDDAIVKTALSANLPKQPAKYVGPVTIEAEDMDFKSIKSCVTDPYGWYPNVRGHAGNGFMDMGTNTAGSLRHEFKANVAGEYTINIRYSNASKNGSLLVNVNNKKTAVKFEKTSMNSWKTVSLKATINEGANTLYITNSNGVGMYIDNVTYIPEGEETEKYDITLREVENGTAVCDKETAAEGELVTLTAIPAQGYKFVGWNVTHGSITISNDNTFTMPDDNVTISPIFIDASIVYNLDFTNVLGGTIPQGWKVVQENNDAHEYPNSFGSGSRTMEGFGGYQGKALYWREGYAQYGSQKAYPLTLSAGKYKFTYAMAAWKSTPKYKAEILDTNGKVIAMVESNYAMPNANGNTSSSVSTAKKNTIEFDIEDEGNYIIKFTNLDKVAGFDEFLLLECKINSMPIEEETSIADVMGDSTSSEGVFSITGVKQNGLQKGINIIRMKNGASKKIFVK